MLIDTGNVRLQQDVVRLMQRAAVTSALSLLVECSADLEQLVSECASHHTVHLVETVDAADKRAEDVSTLARRLLEILQNQTSTDNACSAVIGVVHRLSCTIVQSPAHTPEMFISASASMIVTILCLRWAVGKVGAAQIHSTHEHSVDAVHMVQHSWCSCRPATRQA